MKLNALEHEIAGVYEVGQSMFSAALLATREEAHELERVVETAQRAEARLARGTASARCDGPRAHGAP